MLIQKTVYFREEDIEAWENVQNKAQWLHDALTTGIVTIPAKSLDKTKDSPSDKKPVTITEVGADNKRSSEFEVRLCKNGHPIIRGNRCGFKGCKYNAY